jgi:hypothetical protein
MEYVEQVDTLLEASLSREVLAEEEKKCRHCTNGVWAVWRCRDCSLGSPMCRGCFRFYHRENPFHRIEQWNGNFYRPAEISEVGIHLLVQHHNGLPLCETLKAQQIFLESLEKRKDDAEQESLNSRIPAPQPAFNIPPGQDIEMEDDVDISRDGNFNDDENDEQFFKYLHDLREHTGERSMDEEEQELEDDMEEEEIEAPIEKEYISHNFSTGAGTNTGADINTGPGPAIMGTYVRVVHTNGIHNIAMITCDCRGHNTLPCDLVAARLLPASFKRIRTLFTAQLLNHFRLCNLELKASAYQYYHLLRRLTNPMAPTEVVNLYREFRRMSRLWRWMNRLKWAGISNGGKKVSDVSAGQLAVFCLACPQPGINIPDDWRVDPNRQVLIHR